MWCVTQYSEFLSIYNRTNTLIHYLLPFLINLICTIYLIVLIARHRAKTNKNKARFQVFREQLKKQKELFIPPMIIIISALPQFIISFSLACTELDTKWQRYMLTAAYFLSYAPYIMTFHLYVQSSTFFSNEFYSTNMGKILKQQLNRLTLKYTNHS